MANLSRSFGWNAELEVAGDGWRADVLAVLGNRRVVFEAQLSPMTPEVGCERTERFEASGVEVLWVTTKDVRWLFVIPSAKVEGQAGSRTVTRGCAQLDNGYLWKPAPSFGFRNLIGSVLSRKLVTTRVSHISEQIASGARTVDRFHQDCVVWAKATDCDKAAARQARDDKRAAEQERDRKQHEAHIRALHERQQQILPEAMKIARSETGLSAWAGDEPRWHPSDAEPDPADGMGVPIWVGRSRPERVWGVVCPVASRIDGHVRDQLRDLAIFAATTDEAKRIAMKLHGALPVRVVSLPEP